MADDSGPSGGADVTKSSEIQPSIEGHREDISINDDTDRLIAGVNGMNEDADEDDEDDEDGEYEDVVEDNEDNEDEEDEEEDEEDDDGEFRYIEVEIETQENTGSETEPTTRQRRQVMRLLLNSELGRLFLGSGVDFDGLGEDNDDVNDDGDLGASHHLFARRRTKPRLDLNRFPKVPSDEGTELMHSGTFGLNEVEISSEDEHGSIIGKKRLASRILERELATDNFAKQKLNRRLMAQGMLPSSSADMIIHYNRPVYSGQFSDDGNFFFSVNKDFRVRMYDTSNPYKWRYYKTVEYPFGQWTLTDASLSPDNKYLAYTSIRSTVCLAPTDPNDLGDPYILELADTPGNRPNMGYHSRLGGSFGIWSVRFSGDGRELVAGATGGSILVYDIESRRTLHHIYGHDADVNAVCFADKSSPHILYSGSDDTTLKVWDTRSMGDSREAGVFVGHIEGLTYIDSKGDGRYILSNGKDQSMKLWDLRMVMSPSDYNALPPSRRTREPRFDYRWGVYDEDEWYKDPNDNSLVTFRGHRVLRTLIRCHFSPPQSTNSRYVYSGSEDGKVYVWNLDATLAGTIDVYGATKNSRPIPRNVSIMDWDEDEDLEQQSRWKTCVRDVSWHPNAPMIVASAWSGYGMSTGTCTVHSWNDGAEEDEAEPKMGIRVNQKLEVDPALYEPTASGFYSARRFGR